MAKNNGGGARPARRVQSELYCMDRAFGHDWDVPKWEDGPDIRQGRRTIHVHHRVARCTRCESVRIEVFEQSEAYLEKTHNRYRYSRRYRERRRLSQGELRLVMWKEGIS